MSIRAYRINKKELAKDCSFNCWHDSDILDFLLENEFYDGRNCDGAGSIEVPVPTLEKLLTMYPWEANGDYRQAAIQSDIAWARENHRETIEYDCF